jgi:translation initiation factor IF-1
VLCFNKTDLSVKTENGKVETTVKLNDDPEKIKETITGQPGDKVKVEMSPYDLSKGRITFRYK